jgi:hypothetical protein
MTYIEIITAIGIICSDGSLSIEGQGWSRPCKISIINCMEQEKQKDKEKIKLYELYFKTCILQEVKK